MYEIIQQCTTVFAAPPFHYSVGGQLKVAYALMQRTAAAPNDLMSRSRSESEPDTATPASEVRCAFALRTFREPRWPRCTASAAELSLSAWDFGPALWPLAFLLSLALHR